MIRTIHNKNELYKHSVDILLNMIKVRVRWCTLVGQHSKIIVHFLIKVSNLVHM